jgi:hypothetical protein
MKTMYPTAVAVILYTDGGPDHNCKHTSVRLGLLALFLELDLDTMVVMRTAPTQSWGNPVERVMSVLNLGLQGVALARQDMAEVYEKDFKKCNSMSSVRKVAEAHNVGDVQHQQQQQQQEHQQQQQQQEHQQQQQHQPHPQLSPLQQEAELLFLLQEEEEYQVDLQEEQHHQMQDCDEQLEEYHQHLLLEENLHQSHIENLQRQHEVEDNYASRIDMSGWDDDEAENDEVQQAGAQRAQPATIDLTNETTHTNPFIDSYLKSIQSARDTICRQWSECKWDNKNLNNEAPATSIEVNP